MKILLGCDVDPILPRTLASPPSGDIWSCLTLLDQLVESLGSGMPPITWLIRSDESVRFATGKFDSGFLRREAFWHSLIKRGHEVGWHMHLASFDQRKNCFGFDPDPPWLASAHAALAAHVAVDATRTGWDYGSSLLFRRLESLEVRVDFSALPGNIAWHHAGSDIVRMDWLRCPATPYHPAVEDYQRPGALRLLEIPVAQFGNPSAAMIRRVLWRVRHGCMSLAGLGNRTRMLTEPWDGLPHSKQPVWALYFHPEDLAGQGLANFAANIERLRAIPSTEFVTATTAGRFLNLTSAN